ncbi:MAG: aspartate/glutamate racemase family protein [Chitinophagaceae bacterium]|nr:aspartate/glutamate racemase family protein [Chitinophagaceae bacterium]
MEKAGADCILLGANTMHHVAERVQQSVKIPLLHIADVVGKSNYGKAIEKSCLARYKVYDAF